MKNKSLMSIAMGAALWGTIGIFVQALGEKGFSPLEIVTVRVSAAALMLSFYLIISKKFYLFRIKITDGFYFLGTGIISIVFFNWCYFTAIRETSLSVAAILLYTAPAFVTVFSRIIFKEFLTGKKVVSLLLTMIGCSFVIGFWPLSGTSISLFGFAVGIGSAVGYALYSIFGKAASQKYHSLTITAYTFIFASAALLPTTTIWSGYKASLFHDYSTWFYIIGLGLFPSVLAYLLYTAGLSSIESSRASITAAIEPVVSVLIGIIFFGDNLTLWQSAGIILILAAIFIVQDTVPTD